MAILIDGKQASREIRDALRAEAARLKAATGIVPGLAVILVGENPASRIYVGSKEKACEEAGFLSRVYRVPAETAERDILKRIRMLNDDRKIHGILVQLPLPAHIDAADLLAQSLQSERVAFVPGRAFFADGSNGNTLRLSFSCADEAAINEGITRLGRLIRRA